MAAESFLTFAVAFLNVPGQDEAVQPADPLAVPVCRAGREKDPRQVSASLSGVL